MRVYLYSEKKSFWQLPLLVFNDTKSLITSNEGHFRQKRNYVHLVGIEKPSKGFIIFFKNWYWVHTLMILYRPCHLSAFGDNLLSYTNSNNRVFFHWTMNYKIFVKVWMNFLIYFIFLINLLNKSNIPSLYLQKTPLLDHLTESLNYP